MSTDATLLLAQINVAEATSHWARGNFEITEMLTEETFKHLESINQTDENRTAFAIARLGAWRIQGNVLQSRDLYEEALDAYYETSRLLDIELQNDPNHALFLERAAGKPYQHQCKPAHPRKVFKTPTRHWKNPYYFVID